MILGPNWKFSFGAERFLFSHCLLCPLMPCCLHIMLVEWKKKKKEGCMMFYVMKTVSLRERSGVEKVDEKCVPC
jgi:hypothetical protein